MRLKLLALLVLAVSLAVPVASASAGPQIGISENNFQLFSDPNFTALGAKTTRLVVSYNVVSAAAKGDDELTRVTNYLTAAQNAGVEVLVSFEHSRGAAEKCQTNRRLPQCKLPSASDYQKNISAFLAMFPQVKTISPWNEANHPSQPTQKNPKAAAKFTDIVNSLCKSLARNCTIVAVDVLDQADSVKALHPKFKSTTKWIKTFKKAVHTPMKICGIHNYSDVNRFRTDGTKALTKALKCKQYWYTETGGLYDFASFWSASTKKLGKCKTAPACQLKATKFLFSKVVKAAKNVKRVYIYTWFGGSWTPRFDAGIVDGAPGAVTKPRPAFKEVAKHV